MTNWKTKYLEMKLKYINAKQKAGALHTTSRYFYLIIISQKRQMLFYILETNYKKYF